MKALRIALIAALVCFVAMSYAKEDPNNNNNNNKVKVIALEQAIKNPGLVVAMKAQLDTEFLKIEHPGWYYGVVKYQNTTYVIYGKRQAWLRFFNLALIKKKPEMTAPH